MKDSIKMRQRLNPYSNGMKIEQNNLKGYVYPPCLNPYSNGMKIEQFMKKIFVMLVTVLILILME